MEGAAWGSRIHGGEPCWALACSCLPAQQFLRFRPPTGPTASHSCLLLGWEAGVYSWGSGYKSLRQWIYRGWAPGKVHCMVPAIITIFSSLPCQLAQSTSCMAVWSPAPILTRALQFTIGQVSVSTFVKCRPIFISPLQHGNNEGKVYSGVSNILETQEASAILSEDLLSYGSSETERNLSSFS